MPESQTPPARPLAPSASRAPMVYLALLLLFHLAVNLWWLAADNHPIGADAALHLQFAEQYYEAMTSPEHSTVGERFEAAKNIHTIYPPILHLLGALAWLVAPYNTAAMIFVNTLAFLGLIVGVYFFAGTFLSRWQSLFAAFIASFTPFIFAGSRFFLQDLMAAAVVVWCMWALVKTDNFRNTRWMFIFGLICAAGVLVRWTTPLYYAVPAAFAIFAGIIQSSRTKSGSGDSSDFGRIIVNLFIAVAVPGVIMLPWYFNNLTFMQEKYAEVFAGVQGTLDTSDWQDWTHYLLYIINTGTFLPLFIVAALGLPFALLRRRVSMPAAMTVLWVLGSYLLLTLAWSFKSPAPRYILPMLPALAILASIALTSLPGRPFRIVVGTVFSVFLVFQFGNLTFVSYGPIAEVQTPWFAGHKDMYRTQKTGLLVYSDKVYASAAKYFPVFRGENWQTRVFDTMAQHDRDAQYLTSPIANYQSLRITKVDLERMQNRYRPLRNADPLRPTREYVGPLVNVTGDWQEGGASLRAVTKTGGEFEVGELFGPYEAGLLLPDAQEVVVSFGSPFALSALDFVLPPPAEGEAYGIHIDYQPAGSTAFQEFSPPIEVDIFLSSTRYFSFDSVEAHRLRITAKGASQLMDSRVTFYRMEIQSRPFLLNDSSEDMDALAKFYFKTDYFVAADITDKEFELISDRFEKIDSFRANLVTHWLPREFSVLARKHLQPILYNTEPRLRVSLSDTAPGSTRLARPWWRVAEVDRSIAAEGESINWLVPYPAVADMDFGRAYDLRAIDVVPSRPYTPIGNISIQYWDAARETWASLSEDEPFRTGAAKYNAQNSYEVRPAPIEWANPIRTTRLRFNFLGDSIASKLLLANVFVYGEPGEEVESESPPSAAAAKIFDRTDRVTTDFVEGTGAGGPNHYAWAMPLRAGGDTVFEFKILSQGPGTVRLAINGNPSIVFPNLPPASGLWVQGEYALAYRADPGNRRGSGTYRLVVPEDEELGETLDLSVLLVTDHSDSTIAIREVE